MNNIFSTTPLQFCKMKFQGSLLMAYQIGFDLYESATQHFLQRVQNALRNTAPIPIPAATPSGATPPGASETTPKDKEEDMETDETTGEKEKPTAEKEKPETDAAPTTTTTEKKIEDLVS